MTKTICSIRPENFQQEVAFETRLVLLLCMPRSESFPGQVKIIEDIAMNYPEEIKVGLIEEAYIDIFKGNLNIRGTPTFLLMDGGKEINRLIGLADRKALEALIFSRQF